MSMGREVARRMADQKIREKFDVLFEEKSIMSTEDKYDVLSAMLAELYVVGSFDQAWLDSYVDYLRETF